MVCTFTPSIPATGNPLPSCSPVGVSIFYSTLRRFRLAWTYPRPAVYKLYTTISGGKLRCSRALGCFPAVYERPPATDSRPGLCLSAPAQQLNGRFFWETPRIGGFLSGNLTVRADGVLRFLSCAALGWMICFEISDIRALARIMQMPVRVQSANGVLCLMFRGAPVIQPGARQLTLWGGNDNEIPWKSSFIMCGAVCAAHRPGGDHHDARSRCGGGDIGRRLGEHH